MTTTIEDRTTLMKPLNNYTIELLQKYPNLHVLQRDNESGRCTFCILCIISHDQNNQITYRGITYRGITYNSDYGHPGRPGQLFSPSTVYDTLTTNTYYWTLDWYTNIFEPEECQNLLTVEEALPILEQEIMIGKL